jgi:hypothetical protein
MERRAALELGLIAVPAVPLQSSHAMPVRRDEIRKHGG